MTIRRGGVYEYTPVLQRPGTPTKRLVITADHLNDQVDTSLSVCLLVEDSDPGGLLAVRLGDQGWASVIRIERLLRPRVGELLYTASTDEMEQVSAAMRVAYDLWSE